MARRAIINTPVTSITGLYDAVAQAFGKNPDSCHYNCTKIRVAKNFFDEIEEVYKAQYPHDYASAFGMHWVMFGPKAVDDLKFGEVEIEEGFFE